MKVTVTLLAAAALAGAALANDSTAETAAGGLVLTHSEITSPSGFQAGMINPRHHSSTVQMAAVNMASRRCATEPAQAAAVSCRPGRSGLLRAATGCRHCTRQR